MALSVCSSSSNSHCEHELTNRVLEMRRLLAVCRHFHRVGLITQLVLSLALLGPRGVCGSISSRIEVNWIEVNRIKVNLRH